MTWGSNQDLAGPWIEALGSMPTLQLVLVVLSAVAWLIGGNAVFVLHLRRMGRPWWHIFKPGLLLSVKFNRTERLLFASAFAASVALGAWRSMCRCGPDRFRLASAHALRRG